MKQLLLATSIVVALGFVSSANAGEAYEGWWCINKNCVGAQTGAVIKVNSRGHSNDDGSACQFSEKKRVEKNTWYVVEECEADGDADEKGNPIATRIDKSVWKVEGDKLIMTDLDSNTPGSQTYYRLPSRVKLPALVKQRIEP
jgi:hypothetical protein